MSSQAETHSTPFALKRSQPSRFSTSFHTPQQPTPLTADNRQSSSQMPGHFIAPALVDSLPEHFGSHSDFQTDPAFDRRIDEAIKRDRELSRRGRDSGKGMHFYQLKATLGSVAKGTRWTVPEAVLDYAGSLEQGVSVQQGCLARAAVYYYAIDRRVFFYDVGQAIALAQPLSDLLMSTVDFDDPVFELREVEWANSEIRGSRNKNVVMVSQPWRLSVGVCEVGQEQDRVVQRRSRWLKFTPLRYSFLTETLRALHLTDAGQEIMYLDHFGSVCSVVLKKEGWLGQLFKGQKRQLSVRRKAQPTTLDMFGTERRAGFFQRLKHYQRALSSSVASFFWPKCTTHALAVDQKRSLVYTLVDKQEGRLVDNRGLSHTKMLVCWKEEKEGLTERCRVSEVELFRREIEGIITYNVPGGCRIAGVEVVDLHYFPEAYLLVVLQNGIRAYLTVNEGSSFRLAYHQMPPSTESDPNQPERRKASESGRAVSMVGHVQEGSSCMMCVREGDSFRTWCTWKTNEVREKELCWQQVWSNSMTEEQGHEAPKENHFHKVPIALEGTGLTLRSVLGSKQLKTLRLLHSTADPLSSQPTAYLHSSEQYLEHILLLRPVDLLFNAVVAGVRETPILSKIMCEHEVEEVQCLLLSLLTGQRSLFVRDTNLIQAILSYRNRGHNFDSFDSFLADYTSQTVARSYHSDTSRPQEIQPTLVSGDDITPAQREEAIELLILLCRHSTQEGAESSVVEGTTLEQAVLTYMGRVLRVVWQNQMGKLQRKALIISNLLESLRAVVKSVIDRQSYKQRFQFKQRPVNRSVRNERRQSLAEKYNVSPSRHSTTSPKPKAAPTAPRGEALLPYISKVQQLLRLSSGVGKSMTHSFSSALALPSYYYQQLLFGSLQASSTPLALLETYMQVTPMLVTPQLVQAVKVLAQTKGASLEQTFEVVRRHTQLPNYLLEHLRGKGQLGEYELVQLRQQRERAERARRASVSD